MNLQSSQESMPATLALDPMGRKLRCWANQWKELGNGLEAVALLEWAQTFEFEGLLRGHDGKSRAPFSEPAWTPSSSWKVPRPLP